MAQQTINVGTSPNDGTGTPLRTAFQYTNSNFSELYTAVGPSGNNIVVPGSATITGDLTVDTSTLKVVSASDVVGINTASPLTGNDAGLTIGAIGTVKALNIGLQNTFARLREKDAVDAFAITTNMTGSNNQDDATKSSWKVRMGFGNGNDNFIISRSGVGSTTFYDLYSQTTASAIWYDGAGGTRMTLNSTGLGVGASPSATLDIRKNASGSRFLSYHTGGNGTVTAGADLNEMRCDDTTTAYNLLNVNVLGTSRFLITSSGNVGVGGNASVTGIDTGVARLFVVAPNSNTGMAATFIADSVGRGLLVADQGKTNSFGVEVVAGLVKTGGFTSGTSVALFANAVERARVKSTGQVRFVPLAADPSGAEAGDVYYNSSSNKLKCYNGSTWNDLF